MDELSVPRIHSAEFPAWHRLMICGGSPAFCTPEVSYRKVLGESISPWAGLRETGEKGIESLGKVSLWINQIMNIELIHFKGYHLVRASQPTI